MRNTLTVTATATLLFSLISCSPQMLVPIRGRLLEEPATMFVSDTTTNYVTAGGAMTVTDGGSNGVRPFIFSPHVRIGHSTANFTVEALAMGQVGAVEVEYLYGDSLQKLPSEMKSYYGFDIGGNASAHVGVGSVLHLGLGYGVSFHMEGGSYEELRNYYDSHENDLDIVTSGGNLAINHTFRLQQQFVHSPNFAWGLEEFCSAMYFNDRDLQRTLTNSNGSTYTVAVDDSSNTPYLKVGGSLFFDVKSANRVYVQFLGMIQSNEDDLSWTLGYSRRFTLPRK